MDRGEAGRMWEATGRGWTRGQCGERRRGRIPVSDDVGRRHGKWAGQRRSPNSKSATRLTIALSTLSSSNGDPNPICRGCRNNCEPSTTIPSPTAGSSPTTVTPSVPPPEATPTLSRELFQVYPWILPFRLPRLLRAVL